MLKLLLLGILISAAYAILPIDLGGEEDESEHINLSAPTEAKLNNLTIAVNCTKVIEDSFAIISNKTKNGVINPTELLPVFLKIFNCFKSIDDLLGIKSKDICLAGIKNIQFEVMVNVAVHSIVPEVSTAVNAIDTGKISYAHS